MNDLAKKYAASAAYGRFAEPAGDKTGLGATEGEGEIGPDANDLIAYAVNPPPNNPLIWSEIPSTTGVHDAGGRAFEGFAENAWIVRLITYDVRLPHPDEPEGMRGAIGVATRLDTRATFELPGSLAALLGYQAETTIASSAGKDEGEWLEVQAEIAPAEESPPDDAPTTEGDGAKLVRSTRNKKAAKSPAETTPAETPPTDAASSPSEKKTRRRGEKKEPAR